jgi:signal transduction histidine kinase
VARVRVQWLIAIALGAALVSLPNLAHGTLTVAEVIAALIWVAVDGALLALALRWGERRGVSIAWTLAAGYAAAVAFGAIGLATIVWTGAVDASNSIARSLWGWLADGAYQSILILGVWGLFYVIPRVIRDARDRERERQELLREAERSRVRAALEPHFVLNTLTAIGGLVGDDPPMARELIGDLGDLLRDVVSLVDRDRQSAAEEMAWLQRYVRVLEARHRGSLAVELHLDPDAADVPVPVLVLQPLVENAIQHGALQQAGGGHVRVELRLVGAALRCTIENDGPAIAADAIHEGAHGLALTRRRLASVAPGASLEIASAPTGTRAVITIPHPRAT